LVQIKKEVLMKRRKFIKTAGVAGAGLVIVPGFAQETTTAVSLVGEDLDLYAVLDLFAESESLEEFEKALNNEDQGINNLDLNGNGEVEYIKVDEIVEENTHLIILQVEIEENEFQDVATIEIEKKSDDDYTLQVIGAEELYGENYIVEPVTDTSSTTTTVVHIHTYPVVVVMYSPVYTPWISPWRWRARPPWWSPWRMVARSTYRNRWAKSTRRSRYRRTKVKRSTRGRNMYKSRKKTSNRYKKSTKSKKKQTTTTQKKKQTTQKKSKQQNQQQQKKKTTTQKKKTTTQKKKR
jgi:hypothetical protein